MITIIKTVLTTLLRTVGIGGIIVVGVVAYYEFPGLGRIASEKRDAVRQVNLEWQQKVDAAEDALRRAVQRRQAEIAEIERRFLENEQAAIARDEARSNELARALARAREAERAVERTATQSPPPAARPTLRKSKGKNDGEPKICRCLDRRVNPNLLRHIR